MNVVPFDYGVKVIHYGSGHYEVVYEELKKTCTNAVELDKALSEILEIAKRRFYKRMGWKMRGKK
jgi:transcription termination factor Rho